jgi:hypothetical protein
MSRPAGLGALVAAAVVASAPVTPNAVAEERLRADVTIPHGGESNGWFQGAQPR